MAIQPVGVWRGPRGRGGGLLRSRPLVVMVVVAIAIAVGLGLWFRVAHLADQVYNVDEVRGLARSLGHELIDVRAGIFAQPTTTAGEIFRFQDPAAARPLGDALTALAGHPEHPPLYYLLVRMAVLLVGAPVGMRYCSVLLGLLLLPAAFWLCRELFWGTAGRDRVGWVAIAVLSISPYAIEMARLGRQYSLWQLMICLSTASMLLTVRSPRWRHGLLYGVFMALGFYSHWFFTLTALAHGLYWLVLWGRDRAYRLPILRLAIAGSGAVVLFIPWVLVLLNQRQRAQELTTWTSGQDLSLVERLRAWGNNVEELILDFDTIPGLKNPAMYGVLALMGLAIYGLWRWGPRPGRWVLLLPIATTIAGQVVPDLLLGGARSTIARYVVTANLSLSLILAAYIEALLRSRPQAQRTGAIALAGLVALGGLSGAIALINPRTAVGDISLNRPVAALVQREGRQGDNAPPPWILGDGDSRYIFYLSLSHLLPAATEFRWLRLEDPAEQATLRRSLDQGRPLWVYRPKDGSLEQLERQTDLHLEPVIRDERAGNYPWLYRLQYRRPPGIGPAIAP
jgi:hypothetical protein